MPPPDPIGVPWLYLEKRVRDAVMDDPDLFRWQVQNAYRIAAGGFGHGDQSVGAFEVTNCDRIARGVNRFCRGCGSQYAVWVVAPAAASVS